MDLLRFGVLADKLHLRAILDVLGIVELSKKIYYKNEMVLSRKFYGQHEEDIKKIVNSLSDEYSKEVFKKCIAYRCDFKRKDRPSYGPGEQYFDDVVIKALARKKQTFVDCGAFTGDTIESFKKYVNGDYEKAIGFEPDLNNLKILKKNHAKDERVIPIGTGVWSSDTTLRFESDMGGSSKIVSDGASDSVKNIIEVKVKAIDNVDECKNASFIKMDIEGSELEALEGAKGTIKTQRPILAICIYHSDDDMVRLPLWIIEHCNNYSFYCRHYSVNIIETVFYAIPN